MRGGKRIPGDGKVLGRPQGSVKEESYDDQMSFRCWKDMKKMVIKAAKQAGFRGYQAFLRHVVEEYLRRANNGLHVTPEGGEENHS